jgi:hypothetical protein
LLAEWTAKQAAEEINKSGGVKIDGKTYTFEAVAYDNKYTASEGAKVGQALINREGIRYIVFALGMAPVRALQALSEKEGAILFTTGAGKSIKGPQFPFTFTQLNTPFERYRPFFEFVTKENAAARSVVIVEPNDATGQGRRSQQARVGQARREGHRREFLRARDHGVLAARDADHVAKSSHCGFFRNAADRCWPHSRRAGRAGLERRQSMVCRNRGG